MNKVITPQDPEIKEVLDELIARSDAIAEAKKLGQASFREWLCLQIKEIGDALGYIIQGLAVFVEDIGYSFHKGFKEGRERAKGKSIKYRDRGES